MEMAILALSVSYATGQTYRFIDETQLPTDNSIVREYDEHKWVVYSRVGNRSSLSLIEHTSSTPTMQTVDLGDTYVINDMEVFSRRVYFCGSDLSTSPSKAVVGYFNLHSLPSVSMSVAVLDTA